MSDDGDTLNFADHPVSLAEVRSDKSGWAHDWKPRDVLLALLREFDQGKHDACDAMVVCFRHKFDSGATITRFRVSAPDVHVTLGMMEAVKPQLGEPCK